MGPVALRPESNKGLHPRLSTTHDKRNCKCTTKGMTQKGHTDMKINLNSVSALRKTSRSSFPAASDSLKLWGIFAERSSHSALAPATHGMCKYIYEAIHTHGHSPHERVIDDCQDRLHLLLQRICSDLQQQKLADYQCASAHENKSNTSVHTALCCWAVLKFICPTIAAPRAYLSQASSQLAKSRKRFVT
jgi:hypothetical protein